MGALEMQRRLNLVEESIPQDFAFVHLLAKNIESLFLNTKEALSECDRLTVELGYVEQRDKYYMSPVNTVAQLPPPFACQEGALCVVISERKLYQFRNGSWI